MVPSAQMSYDALIPARYLNTLSFDMIIIVYWYLFSLATTRLVSAFTQMLACTRATLHCASLSSAMSHQKSAMQRVSDPRYQPESPEPRA